MAQDTSQTDLSFLDKKDANSLTFKDIFFTVLRNLHWLLIFAAIGGAVGWYYADRSTRIYESHAKIKVYETPESTVSAQLEKVVQQRRRSVSRFLNDEITILTSETALLETARRLNLNTSYFYETRIVKRMKDLYKNSPIEAELPDINERDYASFTVTVSRDSVCTISIDGEEPVTGRLSDTLSTRLGRVCIRPTWALREEYHNTPIKVVRQNIYDVAEHYRSAVSATRNTDSDGIINLALTDRSPERAADILNTMIAVYNEDAIEERKAVIMQTSEFINNRVAQLDAELGSQEAKIATFKKEHQLLNVEDFGQTYMEASKASAEESERLRDQISHARYLQSLTDSNAENKLFPVTIDIDDDNIRQTISDFNKLVLKLDKYKESGTTNNPVVQNMQLELTTLKSNLHQLIESYIGALEQKIVTVEMAGAKARAKINSVPTGQQYVDNIARVQGIKEALYLTLLTKREELLISQPSIEGKAGIIDRARVNPVPVSPDTRRLILIGVLLGLLVPVAVFFLRRMMDTKIRFRKDVENYVTIPVLAEIPCKPKKDDRKIVVADKRRDAVSEAFRILRSNLEYTRNPDGKATCYMMLSLMEGSGKTFMASNVAASLAMIGKRVILLDLDLRKGTLTRNVNLRRHEGISDYLSGKTDDYESLVRHDVVAPGVDLIISGPIPPNPAELLSSPRLDTLFAWLRDKYEFILIDAVPVGIVADPGILKRFVDISVFVIRSGRVDKRMMPDLQVLNDRGDYPNMMIVLNDVNYKKSRYYYSRYGYGYGYGYGHGYGYGYGYGHQYGYGNSEDIVEEESAK